MTNPLQAGVDHADAVEPMRRAIEALKIHIAAIQAAKRKKGTTAPITDCINDLPQIVAALKSAEFEIEAAFEQYEDAAPVLPDRGWRPISDFVGYGQNNPAIVAAPYLKEDGARSWIVGEAYRIEPKHDEEPDWWWANTGPGDYTGDPIGSMGYGGPSYFQPLPDDPAEGGE